MPCKVITLQGKKEYKMTDKKIIMEETINEVEFELSKGVYYYQISMRNFNPKEFKVITFDSMDSAFTAFKLIQFLNSTLIRKDMIRLKGEIESKEKVLKSCKV
jgi:hypothetical protein